MGSPVQLIPQLDCWKAALAFDTPSSSSSLRDGSFNYWDLIPDVLVARILALLPFSSIYLGRGVCQRWRTIIWSPLFSYFCKMRPSSLPWLLEFQQHMYNQSWAYDLEGCQWFHLKFFFLPETAIILASSRGLICLGRMAQEGYAIYVCNPLTKIWKKLPSIAVEPNMVLMDVDRRTRVYRIFALVSPNPGGAGVGGSVFVYDGKIGEWRETPNVPEDLCAGNVMDATVSGGILYCLSTSDRLNFFDIHLGSWRTLRCPTEGLARILHLQQLSQPQGSSVLGNSYLCDQRGRLAMITPHQDLKHVFINKLDLISRTWRWSHVSAEWGSLICAAHFSSLSVSMPQMNRHVYFVNSKGNGYYNAALKSFQHLPRSPLTRNKLQRGEPLKSVWYEPRLDAIP